MIRRTLIFIIGCISLTVSAQNPEAWKNMKGEINLFIANDLGRNGYYEQRPIADLMGRMAEEIGPEAVLALGDVHHFEGVQSVSDPLWMTNFELIYSHPELMVEWLPVCGNHEYRGNTQAVVDYSAVSRRWMMPAKYYSRVFADKGVTIKVLFIDTTPLMEKYRNDTNGYPDAAGEDTEKQLQWLSDELSASREDWVIVVGHHPVYAETPKAQSEREDMQKRLVPVFNRNKVDMYICGHIHNFQHIRRPDSGTDYIVNSSASQSRKKVKAVDGTVFCSGEPGFSVLTVNRDSLVLTMIDKEGRALHAVSRKKR